MSKLAKGWKKEKIASLCQKPHYGYTSKSENRQNNNPKYLRTTDITKEKLDWDSVPYCIAPVKNEEGYLIKRGDIFITRAGSVGENILIKDIPPRAVFASYLIRIKSLDRISNLYLSYYFQSPFFWNYIAEKKDGITTPNVNAQKLANIEVPYPESKREQNRIVEGIETQFTRLDAAKKSLESVKKRLGTYRKSVLKAVFEGKLCNISEWENISVNDLGEIVTGTTPSKRKKKYYGGGHFFFKPTDLNRGYFVTDSQDKLSREGIRHARLLPAQSILVTCIGATIGKTGFNRITGATNQQINAIVPDRSKYIPEIVYYIFISDEMQRKIIANASSTTLPILNKSKFSNLRLKIPRIKEEQKQVVEEIESRFFVIDKVGEVVDNALLKAEKLRKSILKSAFEGRLVKYEGGSHD